MSTLIPVLLNTMFEGFSVDSFKGGEATHWTARQGPWKLSITDFSVGRFDAGLYYCARWDKPGSGDPAEVERSGSHEVRVWVVSGDDLTALLQEIRAELDYALSSKTIPTRLPISDQAMRVLEALSKKPDLLAEMRQLLTPGGTDP